MVLVQMSNIPSSQCFLTPLSTNTCQVLYMSTPMVAGGDCLVGVKKALFSVRCLLWEVSFISFVCIVT